MVVVVDVEDPSDPYKGNGGCGYYDNDVDLIQWPMTTMGSSSSFVQQERCLPSIFVMVVRNLYNELYEYE